jgi:creatinine amidohydrolase
MRFEDLNWFDLEEYLTGDDRLMFVLGACEQHAYLSLLTDRNIPRALGDAASQKTGVPLAPALNFGISPFFLAYPGTLSLQVETFLQIIQDLLHSAYQQGFRRFLILNGHGGNSPVTEKLSELTNQYQDIKIVFYSWYDSPDVQAVSNSYQLAGYHASWYEAFSFNRVADLPDGEKEPVADPGLIDSENVRRILGDGSFGGKYHVSDQIMEEIFQAALEDVLQLLEFNT